MSRNNITFLEDVTLNYNSIFNIPNPSTTRFYFCDTFEVTQFLDFLEKDKTYVLSLELINSWLTYEEDTPVFVLSKPIVVTKDSDAEILSKYLQSRIKLACDSFFLEENMMEDAVDNPAVLVRFKEINLFL